VLTELIISITILTFIIIAVSSLTSGIFSYQAYNAESMRATDEIRSFMKRFVAELRSAELSDSGGYPIAIATPTEIKFYTDIDGDDDREQVRYFVDSGTLYKEVSKSSGVPPIYAVVDSAYEVVHNLVSSDIIFSYYPSLYAGTTTPLATPIDVSAIRLVKVEVTVDEDINREPGPVNQSTQINIRNLKDNL